jgi:hypothetical protein
MFRTNQVLAYRSCGTACPSEVKPNNPVESKQKDAIRLRLIILLLLLNIKVYKRPAPMMMAYASQF